LACYYSLVACPFFYPAEPFPGDGQIRQGRFPLGAAHKGICRAMPDEVFEPDEEMLRSFCNFGYGRGACARFPSSSDADAVRFSLVSQPDETTRIVFVFERDFGPVRHGTLDCSAGEQSAGDCLARQAEVFAANYSRKARCA
jgi:hypothetical protein